MNKIARTTLSPNHGLEPREVQLYRLLRLMSAPNYFFYLNSVTGRELLKSQDTWNAINGLRNKGYIQINKNKESNAKVIWVVK